MGNGICSKAFEDLNNESNIFEKGALTFKDYKGFKPIESIDETYELGEVLGEGSFGQVRRARHKMAGIDCAVKIIKKKAIQQH